MNICEHCHWWRPGSTRSMPFPGKNECHANPPAALVGSDGRFISIFPVTRNDDFCGLWEERDDG